MSGRPWTLDETVALRVLYPRHPAPAVARRLGRTVKAVHQAAAANGLRKQSRAAVGPAFDAELTRHHAAGLTDPEAAAALGCERHTVSAARKRLGLPRPRDGSARYRAKVAANTRAQVAALGLDSLGDVRALAFAARSVAAGWPATLRPREVEILAALSRGPLTRPEIAAAVGMPWKGSRASLACRYGRGSYLANLMAANLVVSLGRVARVTGGGRGRSLHLYSLSATAVKRSRP